MRFRSLFFWSACSGAAWLALSGPPAAHGQVPGKRCQDQAPPVCVDPTPSPAIVMPKVPDGTTPTPAPAVSDTASEAPPEFAGSRPPAAQGESFAMRMLGNQLGIPATSFIPGNGSNNGRSTGAVLAPSVRGFRISEDESPRPQDRVYLGFNYFDDVNASVNRRIGADVANINVFRETLGFEKTFLDGDASIGMRLPLNTLEASSPISDLNGSHTDIGDLTVILKYAFWKNDETGSLASGGVAVTLPTGPDSFADSHVTTFHDTVIQPWVGYIWSFGDLYVHGFSALDIPTDSNDVTYWFNDLGVGYYVYKSPGCERMLSAVVPTLELHLSNPLNHRGSFSPTDRAGSSDILDVTAGVTLELNHRSTLAVGFVTPVTGPKPFAWETLVQLNYSFGGGRAAQSPRSFALGN